MASWNSISVGAAQTYPRIPALSSAKTDSPHSNGNVLVWCPALVRILQQHSDVLFCFKSCIYNPLHAARRAMAAAVPLPLRSNGGLFYGIPLSYLEPACAVIVRYPKSPSPLSDRQRYKGSTKEKTKERYILGRRARPVFLFTCTDPGPFLIFPQDPQRKTIHFLLFQIRTPC